ncbi:MAG TPA: response regulator, partial [Thermoanaerobaculia bacterium]|nr:response regulator [Thermoanaerobaculia bacterium]
MKKVLIAEDDGDIRTLLQIVLQREGIAVDCASNGAEALSWMKNKRYTLLILDMMMPVMSGDSVIQHLKNLPERERPEVVLVISAGRQHSSSLDPAIVRGVISKPFDVFELARLVRDLLGSTEQTRAGA